MLCCESPATDRGCKRGIQRSAEILELQMALFHFVGNKITEIRLCADIFLSSKHQNHKPPMFILKVPPRFLLPICPVKNFHPPNPQNLWGPQLRNDAASLVENKRRKAHAQGMDVD